jgi:hypothetical protein
MEAAREVPADAAGWTEPPQQRNTDDHLHRAALDGPTPVAGTAQRPRGVSGSLRRAAYEVPEHYARHWMLLLMADRIDVLESRLGSTLADPMERAGLHGGARLARHNPLAVLAGAVAGAWVVKRVL